MTRPLEDRERAPLYVLAGALSLHLALLWYFFPWRLFAAKLPILEYDYSLHAYQVDRALRAFEASGRLWSYDPFVLAGQPAGAVEDLTSKSLEYFVILAHSAGVGTWVAFDAYVLFVHLGLLPVAWAAARLFGLCRLAASLTVLFWVVLWHFDSFLHWCWYIGMISWALASYLAVLTVALMYRALRDHRARHYAALGVVAAAVTFVHPFAVATLAVPLGALYARAFRRARQWEHAALATSTVAAAATALTWLGPALKFRHYIGPVDAFLWPTLSYALFDWLDVLKDFSMTGEPVRTALRTLSFVLAAVGLFRLHRSRDDRVLPLGLLVIAAVAQAYLSGYSHLLRQTQPYRHIAPATLAAALIAAFVVVRVARSEREATPRDARTALLLAGLVALPPLAKTALGYLPGLLPRREHSLTAFRPGPGVFASSAERDPPFMGHSPPPNDFVRIGQLVDAFGAGAGRVVATDWVLGEYLATFTAVPTLGGIAERNVPHVAAHPLRHDLTRASATDDPLSRYFTEYAAMLVVTDGDTPFLDQRRDLLDALTIVGRFHVYRVRAAPSYFAVGTGRIVRQELNSVRVEGAAGDRVVLRFHFMETLRCRPNCTVERAAAGGDAVGFVEVRQPPASFEIYNEI